MIPKFRAWDKGNKKLKQVYSINFDKNGEIESIKEEYTEPNEAYAMFDIRYFELMQSTGLTDKNGTEIYEGDIVNFDGLYEIRFGIHGVPRLETEQYVDTATGFYFKPQHDLKDVKPFNLDIPLNDRYANECVVVGNIYQHSHLLEEDNHASN